MHLVPAANFRQIPHFQELISLRQTMQSVSILWDLCLSSYSSFEKKLIEMFLHPEASNAPGKHLHKIYDFQGFFFTITVQSA